MNNRIKSSRLLIIVTAVIYMGGLFLIIANPYPDRNSLYWLLIVLPLTIGISITILLRRTPIQTLKTFSRLLLFVALGISIYYSAKYNPILVLPITGMIIGYGIVLAFQDKREELIGLTGTSSDSIGRTEIASRTITREGANVQS